MPIIKLKNYDPVPPGTYHLQITSCDLRVNSTNSEQEFCAWKLAVLDEDWDDFDGGALDQMIGAGHDFDVACALASAPLVQEAPHLAQRRARAVWRHQMCKVARAERENALLRLHISRRAVASLRDRIFRFFLGWLEEIEREHWMLVAFARADWRRAPLPTRDPYFWNVVQDNEATLRGMAQIPSWLMIAGTIRESAIEWAKRRKLLTA